VPSFTYDPAIAARFPSIVGGVVHATGITNGPSPEALVDEFTAEQHAVRAQIGATSLSELPSLAAWRRAFRSFGVDPTAAPPARRRLRSW